MRERRVGLGGLTAAVRGAGGDCAIACAVSYFSFRLNIARTRGGNSWANGQKWYRTSTNCTKFLGACTLEQVGAGKSKDLTRRAQRICVGKSEQGVSAETRMMQRKSNSKAPSPLCGAAATGSNAKTRCG